MVLSRFSLFQTKGEARRLAPYLVLLSADFLDPVNVCIIAPVRTAKAHGPLRQRLHVPVTQAGESLVVVTEELASVPKSILGKPVGSLEAHRAELVAALDFLFQGY